MRISDTKESWRTPEVRFTLQKSMMEVLRSIGDCWINGIVLICALQIASDDSDSGRFLRATTPIRLSAYIRGSASSYTSPSCSLCSSTGSTPQAIHRHAQPMKDPVAIPPLALIRDFGKQPS